MFVGVWCAICWHAAVVGRLWCKPTHLARFVVLSCSKRLHLWSRLPKSEPVWAKSVAVLVKAGLEDCVVA